MKFLNCSITGIPVIRKMAPKVFGIGLGKTGTSSLNQALRILGYNAAHIPHIPITQVVAIAHRYDALADSPVAAVFADLDRAYPGSKFIFTVRDVESWLVSWSLHDQRVRALNGGEIPDAYKVLRTSIFGFPDFIPYAWERAYRRHDLAVRRHFLERPNDLQVMNICAGDRWHHLCTFLGHSIPSVPFPHSNSRHALLPPS